MRKDTDERKDREVQRKQKRPYAKPRLLEYGSVAKLTQSGGTTRTETGGGMRPCL